MFNEQLDGEKNNCVFPAIKQFLKVDLAIMFKSTERKVFVAEIEYNYFFPAT